LAAVRRLLKVLAALAVILAGVIAAVVIHRVQGEGNIHGSSTVEFVTTENETTPLPTNIAWPEYGFEGTRSRAVTLALRPPYRRIWTFKAGSLVEFPPAIGYGRLYFSTNSGKVYAVNTKTGKRAWKYISHRCVAASPAIGTEQHGTVYAVFLNKPPCNAKHGQGEVIAFSAGFGKVRWHTTIGASETSPLLVGNRLYVGDWDGRVWALDARTGRTIWRHKPARAAIKGAIAISDGRLYLGSYDGHLYCLGAQKGRLIWKAKAQSRLYGRTRFYSTPAVAYGRVYIGGTDGKVYSFGATSGKIRWSHGTGGYVYASPAIWKGLVLVGSYSKRFFAFDAATGDVRWSYRVTSPISGSATVIGNIVYFATLGKKTNGRTYALNARTGRLVWSYPDGKYTPAVAEKGRLFLVGYARVYGMVPR
jgi:outer membrane protein assembly factor BamB